MKNKISKKIIEIIKSPRFHVELATGFSIIAMAFASKWLLPNPISYLANAIPAFFIVIFEVEYKINKDSKICTSWYWITAILISTALVIMLHMN